MLRKVLFSILAIYRRELWKQRQEEKKLIEEALSYHQKIMKESAEDPENKKCSATGCLIESCIICKYKAYFD